MLQRLYVHNFRCLENFEFKPGGSPSALLVGKNGAGKSTLLAVMRIFQAIGRGVNRVGSLVTPEDFALGRSSVPIRLELEVVRDSHTFHYMLALELPERSRDLQVAEEQLAVDGKVMFFREKSMVTVSRVAADRPEDQLQFAMDSDVVALTVIQGSPSAGALGAFKNMLASMVLLAPVPKLMSGEAERGTREPEEDSSNWADWMSGLLDRFPSAYAILNQHLKQVLPDLADFRFERTGRDAKSLLVRFKHNQDQHELPAAALSDGEKCFFLCAVVLAANHCDGPLFTFWDEPDNYLSLSEVSQFVMALRRGFQQGGQILMTSHNPEAIRRFSDENTWVMGRRSHLEPAVIRKLGDLASTSDLVQKLIDGDLDPWG
jgi:predicted ATPase